MEQQTIIIKKKIFKFLKLFCELEKNNIQLFNAYCIYARSITGQYKMCHFNSTNKTNYLIINDGNVFNQGSLKNNLISPMNFLTNLDYTDVSLINYFDDLIFE